MTSESAFLELLRPLSTHPAARGLVDDAAVLAVAAGGLVLTHDMLVEGVHYLAADPAADVAWKLLAVNLSDLAAKGAEPLGVLLGFALGDAAWDAAFVGGLGEALGHFNVPLLGGDTVAIPAGAPRVLGVTAIGRAPACGAPARSGALPGDGLWITGTIGDAGLGLRIARGDIEGPVRLRDAYRRPRPRLAAGAALAPHVHAMADVSDGLLLDASRIAAASGVAVTIDLDALPLSREARAFAGDGREARLAAATAGDDYQLLFAAGPRAPLAELGLDIARIGTFAEGAGVSVFDRNGEVPLPPALGYLHGVPTGRPSAAC